MIFMHLSVHDLLNVAESNKQLKQGVDMAFQRKYGNRAINLIIGSQRMQCTTMDEHSIEICDLQTSLQFVRCFGHLIKKVAVGGEIFSRFFIVRYVNEFCSESLTEIAFESMRANALLEIKKPFLNVHKVTFFNCQLNRHLKPLSKWFPKVENLEVYRSETISDCIEANYPHMRRLAVKERHLVTESLLDFTQVIELNPQLVSVALDTDVWAVILRCMGQNLLNLEYLSIAFDNGDLHEFTGDVVRFKRLKHLQINNSGRSICDHSSSGNYSGGIPIACDQLEEFTCDLYFASISEILIDFFKSNPTITRLNLTHNPESLTQAHVMAIANALPLLQHVNFGRIDMSFSSALSFIRACQSSLQTFRFRFDKFYVYEDLIQLIDNGDHQWKLTIDIFLNIKFERINESDTAGVTLINPLESKYRYNLVAGR